MAAWAVVFDDEFLAELESVAKSLMQCTKDAQGRAAFESAMPRFDEFDAFTSVIFDLKVGRTDPTAVLTYNAFAPRDSPTCALVVGRWRAVFRVDKATKRCTAKYFEEVFPVPPIFRRIFHRPLQ